MVSPISNNLITGLRGYAQLDDGNQQLGSAGYLFVRKRGSSKRVVTAMSPFPEGSSMVNTWPTNAGPPPPPPLIPPPGLPPAAAAEPAIRAPGSGSGPRRDSADDDAEETGRRSGKARWGAWCAGEVADEVAAEDGEGRKGKVEEAREWKGLEEERGMVDR